MAIDVLAFWRVGLEETYLEGLLDFEVVLGQARGDFVNSLEETYKVTWLLLGNFYLQIISSKLNNCLQQFLILFIIVRLILMLKSNVDTRVNSYIRSKLRICGPGFIGHFSCKADGQPLIGSTIWSDFSGLGTDWCNAAINSFAKFWPISMCCYRCATDKPV